MIVDDVITAIFKKLKLVSTVPVYKYARPSDESSPAYFVINSLPIGSGILQKCVVNVNAYCNDVAPGSPDAKKLADMTVFAIQALDQAQNDAGNIFMFFQQQNVFQGEELKSHYSNIRFDIRLLNS